MIKILTTILLTVSVVFGGGIYDITTGKWTDTGKTEVSLEGGGSFDIGYAGYFVEGGSYNGFIAGGSAGKNIHAGVDISFGFYRDELSSTLTDDQIWDSIGTGYSVSDRAKARMIDEFRSNMDDLSLESNIINPVFIIGGQYVKVGFGAIIMTTSINNTTLNVNNNTSKSGGFSTGIKINMPTNKNVSPFIDASFIRVEKSNIFGLKLGLSLGEFYNK